MALPEWRFATQKLQAPKLQSYGDGLRTIGNYTERLVAVEAKAKELRDKREFIAKQEEKAQENKLKVAEVENAYATARQDRSIEANRALQDDRQEYNTAENTTLYKRQLETTKNDNAFKMTLENSRFGHDIEVAREKGRQTRASARASSSSIGDNNTGAILDALNNNGFKAVYKNDKAINSVKDKFDKASSVYQSKLTTVGNKLNKASVVADKIAEEMQLIRPDKATSDADAKARASKLNSLARKYAKANSVVQKYTNEADTFNSKLNNLEKQYKANVNGLNKTNGLDTRASIRESQKSVSNLTKILALTNKKSATYSATVEKIKQVNGEIEKLRSSFLEGVKLDKKKELEKTKNKLKRADDAIISKKKLIDTFKYDADSKDYNGYKGYLAFIDDLYKRQR